MTLDEKKLAVCEKLPELTLTEPSAWRGGTQQCGSHFSRKINWPTEGLQVCHEAEKPLIGDDWQRYMTELSKLCGGYGHAYHATFEQRLEALCRVWWPERFNV